MAERLMHTINTGDITKLKIMSVLLQSGKTILTPFTENCRYDLVFEDENGFHKVQCKTGKLVNGSITFRCASVYKVKGITISRSYTKQEIDFYGVYCPQVDRCYLVPVEDAGKFMMKLRYDLPLPNRNGHQHLRWASEYILEK